MDDQVRTATPLRSVPPAPGPRTRSAHLAISAELPDGLTVETDWPDRTVVVVTGLRQPQVVATVTNAGFVPIMVPPDLANDMVVDVGPFTFLMVGPDSVADAAGIELVRSIRSCSPSARVILLADDQNSSPSTLVGAARVGVTEVVDPSDADALRKTIESQLKLAGERRERVLAIGAHPDDVEIGCSGTLLSHRRRGDRISLLTLSRGGGGGDEEAGTHEAVAAAEAIGAQLILGDLVETRIDDGVDTIRLLEAVVTVLQPTIVYVHSKHDGHQDHRAVHTAAMSATRGVPSVFAYQSPSANNDFMPTKFVAIDQFVSEKVKVLGVFGSQDERPYVEPELVVAGARYWARHLAPRAHFAEPFEVIRDTDEFAPGSRSATDRLGNPSRQTSGGMDMAGSGA
ncbi:MAG: PIG-L family deacetylase [Nocardioidaceae bacterium]